MNFGKLLAAGKSIINGRISVAYRENKNVYLPKFESPKNPFGKPVPAAGAEQESPAPVAEGSPVKLSVRGTSGSSSGNWAANLNPLSMFRGTPAPVARPVRAEQTELSLDTVKVVHNDLTDADVEVVPLKSRPARPTVAASADTEWSEVGNRVLGTNLV